MINSNPLKLKYLGPVSTFALEGKAEDNSDGQYWSLVPGRSYDDLPLDHPVIKKLRADRLLVPDEDDKAEASPDLTGGDSRVGNSDDTTAAPKGASKKGKSK